MTHIRFVQRRFVGVVVDLAPCIHYTDTRFIRLVGLQKLAKIEPYRIRSDISKSCTVIITWWKNTGYLLQTITATLRRIGIR